MIHAAPVPVVLAHEAYRARRLPTLAAPQLDGLLHVTLAEPRAHVLAAGARRRHDTVSHSRGDTLVAGEAALAELLGAVAAVPGRLAAVYRPQADLRAHVAVARRLASPTTTTAGGPRTQDGRRRAGHRHPLRLGIGLEQRVDVEVLREVADAVARDVEGAPTERAEVGVLGGLLAHEVGDAGEAEGVEAGKGARICEHLRADGALDQLLDFQL